jgi:hypothetical protein
MNTAPVTKKFAQTTPDEKRSDYDPTVSRLDSASVSKPESLSISSPESGTSEKQRVNEERIRQRAYEIYEDGGFQDGNADRDWFAAERELTDEKGAA